MKSSRGITAIAGNLLMTLSLGLVTCTCLAFTGTDEVQQLIASGKYNEALEIAENRLEADSGNVTYLFLKGLVLTKLDRLEDARDVFINLTNSHPELPEPYNNLAVVYAAMGQFENARAALQRAINTHPSYATAHENMGDIYAKMASHAYSQALELDEDNRAAKTKLALVNDLFSVPDAAPLRPPVETPARQSEPAAVADAADSEAPYPGPVPIDTAVDEESEKEAVKSRIEDWANAWSDQDPDDYLSFYAGDFVPPKKMTRKAWENNRRQRLKAPRFIRVEVSNIQVIMHGREHAQVIFSQKYESDTYRDRVTKVVLLKKEGDNWYIAEEKTR